MKKNPNLLVLAALVVGYMGGVLSFKDGRVWVQKRLAVSPSEEQAPVPESTYGVIVRRPEVAPLPVTVPNFTEEDAKQYGVFDRSVEGIVSISSTITIPTSRERHIRDLLSREVSSMHVLVGTVKPVFDGGYLTKIVLEYSKHPLPPGYRMRVFVFFPDEVPVSDYVNFVERLNAEGGYKGCVAGSLLDGFVVRGGLAVCLSQVKMIET